VTLNAGQLNLVSGKMIPLEYPSFIKYMGSKSKIMDFVVEGINEVHRGGVVCDLFSGSASLAGALGQQCAVHSNDIQSYSAVLADVYSRAFRSSGFPTADQILNDAEKVVTVHGIPWALDIDYSSLNTLSTFNKVENQQKKLIKHTFSNDWHLFAKNYSGTWWSYTQCAWIDAIREVAERYKNTAAYNPILASLMFAMAYASQGTGHYAQYRDAKTKSSLKDISIYRRRSIASYFRRKFEELTVWLPETEPVLPHKSTSLDYVECLKSLEGGTVYADPPYCFVHYSRFYHAIETLVRYDYPELQEKKGKVVKGRYRDDRHQSPFCIKTKVSKAFQDLFQGVADSGANLAMSYSNTGMISIEEVQSLASDYFANRRVEVLLTDHQHMTLGRLKDRHRDVQECLLLVK
jgi:adenine-specific DNA-methyltransferase|tara:strand:- start:1386 stop:2603 length:1218 start_codon:yes stop_codon:yes gene_type:complete